MSILNYFTRADKETSNVVIPTGGVPGISENEIININITDHIQSTSGVKRKRVSYSEQDKMKIAKYANECLVIGGWLNKYRSQLKANLPSSRIVISEKRGRPLYLPDELDKKLRAFITYMRMAGGIINRHVIFGVLMGLIKSDLATYGMYLDFLIT